MAKRGMTEGEARALVEARGLGSREAALAARVELDVRKWGEPEREASWRLNERRSHALLLNSIAVYDIDHVDEPLREAAGVLMTAADDRELRKGG